MPSRADQLRAKAEECRAFAATVKDAAVHLQLLSLAKYYNSLVEISEHQSSLEERAAKDASAPGHAGSTRLARPAEDADAPLVPDIINSLAGALIATHGDGAVAFAEEAMGNVRALGMEDRVEEWERVIAAINAMRETAR